MFQAPRAAGTHKGKRTNFEQIVEFCRSPKAFLKIRSLRPSIAPRSIN